MKKRTKLGRKSQHRDAMLANMVVSLIKHHRIKTTLAKAKALRPVAEKIVTLGKDDTLHHRRLAIAKLGQRDAVTKLFKEIAPKFKERNGGYTRIIKLGPRLSDAAPTAFIEWVETFGVEPTEPKTAKKSSSKKDKGTEAQEKTETSSTATATTEPEAKEIEVEVEKPRKSSKK